ncbi:MAG: phosphodiesterase [Bacilli bacterium]|nr:phosphodiesterase [Mollicutes bacterium]MDY3899775.1 phosphodiesterase [Bacilli bacterium]
MKWLIASDIHGSLYYGKKLIEQIKKEEPDKVIFLGDILYHGPRNDLPNDYNPKELIKLLNEYKDKIISVRGNCDSEVDQMVLEFPIMADYMILTINDLTIFATHGHLYDVENIPFKGIDVVLSGHTHVQKCDKYDNYVHMNPGSVSIPKENSYHGYMVVVDKVFYWKDLEGNIINKFEC